MPLGASKLLWLATCSSWDSSCLHRAAWPPTVQCTPSGKRNCFQLSPLTQTFKSKHSKATDHVCINKIWLRKDSSTETKGVFKKLPSPSKEASSKAAVIPRACLPGRAGWLRPQAFEEEMPSLRQAGSQPLSPKSTREKQKAVKVKREQLGSEKRKEAPGQINEKILPN